MPADSEEPNRSQNSLGRLLFSTPAVAFLVAIASILVSGVNFKLARSTAENQPSSESTDALRLESRIWQDPSELLMPNKLHDTNFWNEVPTASERNWKQLARGLFDGVSKSNAVLFVINNQSPYAHGAEVRLRTRIAVLSALRAAGLVKKGGDETLFVQLPSLVRTPNMSTNSAQDDEVSARTSDCLVPSELFIHDETVQNTAQSYSSVLVMWLPERNVSADPWTRFYSILRKLAESSEDIKAISNMQMCVLGPRTSDGLAAWFNGGASTRSRLPSQDPAWLPLNNMRIISTSARAPDAFYTFGTNANISRPRQGAETELRSAFTNCTVQQFGGTDDRLCFALAAELALRGVDVTTDEILLLSEYDTFYGRSLPLSFKAAASSLQRQGYFHSNSNSPLALQLAVFSNSAVYSAAYSNLLVDFYSELQRLRTNDVNCASNIHYATYLAGLDGSKTIADNPKESVATKSAMKESNSVDDPVGEQQLDYTKRLAYQLSSVGTYSFERPSTRHEVKAVGLLGNDVFDKMLMLQALRPRLPQCVFFTTEIDASYSMPSQTKWTRNLITASGFDLEIPHSETTKSPVTFAPFRDGYQTAAFMGTLSFLTGDTNLPSEDLGTYEIGRTRVHRLANTPRNRLLELFTLVHPRGSDLRVSWERMVRLTNSIFSSPALTLGIVISVVFVIATAFPSRHTTDTHWLAVIVALVLIVIIMILGLVAVFSDGLEPIEIGDGVSVFPSALLVFMAMVLGLYGCYRTDQADGERSVSHNAAFIICIPAMIALVILVLYAQPCPMRSPDRMLFQIVVGFAWGVSGILCVATIFIWRSFLKEITQHVYDANSLDRAPGTKPKLLNSLKESLNEKGFNSKVLFLLLCALVLGLCIGVLLLHFLPLGNLLKFHRISWKIPLYLVLAIPLVVTGVTCVVIIHFYREKVTSAANSQPPPIDFYSLLSRAANLSRDVERFGPLSYFPMCTLLFLVLASSPWLDNWHPTIWLILLFLFEVTMLLSFPLLVCKKGTEFKRILSQKMSVERLNKCSETNPDFAPLERKEKALELLNRGCFAPISQQPVLGAFATLVGGSGLVTLIQQLFFQG